MRALSLSPPNAHVILFDSRYTALTIDHNMDVQYQACISLLLWYKIVLQHPITFCKVTFHIDFTRRGTQMHVWKIM